MDLSSFFAAKDVELIYWTSKNVNIFETVLTVKLRHLHTHRVTHPVADIGSRSFQSVCRVRTKSRTVKPYTCILPSPQVVRLYTVFYLYKI